MTGHRRIRRSRRRVPGGVCHGSPTSGQRFSIRGGAGCALRRDQHARGPGASPPRRQPGRQRSRGRRVPARRWPPPAWARAPRSTTRGAVKERRPVTPLLGGYGRFDSTVVGGGPVCVKAWKAGADNGGATWQGVTKDKITVVAVLPNDTQLETDPVKPKHKADKSPSTYENAIHDVLDPADEVLRDVGSRHRGQVRHVVGQRRSRAARRRRRGQGDEAVRGVQPHRGGSRRARDRARQGEDPELRLLHHREEGEPAGAVPLGPE